MTGHVPVMLTEVLEALSPRDGELLLSWGPAAAASRVTLSNQVSALLAGSLWVGLYIQDF